MSDSGKEEPPKRDLTTSSLITDVFSLPLDTIKHLNNQNEGYGVMVRMHDTSLDDFP